MLHLTVLGNLGADAEVKVTPAGQTVTEMRVACNAWNGKERATQWVRVSMWGERGEKLAQYLTKGKMIVAHGAASIRQYEGKNGPGVSVDVRADDVQLAGGPANRGDAAEPRSNGHDPEADLNDDFPPEDAPASPPVRVAPKAVVQRAVAKAKAPFGRPVARRN